MVQFIKNNLINNKELDIILLGNKYDLGETDPKFFEVKKRDIDNYIYNIDNLYYYNISCKTNYNYKKIKEIINNIEINVVNEEDQIISEEERKKKVNQVENSSCSII